MLEEIEATLERRLSAFVTHDFTVAGGIEVGRRHFQPGRPHDGKDHHGRLEEEDPELAEEIKKRMFVFEDITLLSDRDIQLIVREVESDEWALAQRRPATK